MIKRICTLFTALLITCAGATSAWATSIVSTSPTVGSVLSVSPTAVTIKANADLLDGLELALGVR